ncbi:type IV secretory system conjugative DNA transfer family protein [Mesorhizobium sp. ES1-1]|uniref:type IV secretory system conjugative DNA transfer family protein n=1 Tax=Mesorhizobium sp. ES1-1 TaxID=2876629 RepID=UPI001CC91586|nr:type IV secretory system conjugative DNA transfer family protein [Mesorhizobium sp. ES1-1]MBZ9674568.1 type IV secretory system conjugative DNA transfer family protein [Mesorhizobium sp. ES1-1]
MSLIAAILFIYGVARGMRELWNLLTAPAQIAIYLIRVLFSLFADAGRVIIGYWGLRNKTAPTHGNAELASWKQLKNTNHAKPDGWLMGLLDGHRVYTDAEACVIGVAPRRTGKSNMGKAQLLAQAKRDSKPDVVCFDPHGDLRPAVLRTFINQGYRTLFLNFEQPMQSDHHNPLSFVRAHPFHQGKDADQIMKLIMAAEKGANEHFTNFPRVVMAGVIAYMLRTNPTNAKLHSVVEMMIADDKNRAVMFDDMILNGGPLEKAAVVAYRNAGERERGSFGTTMTWKLGIWLRPGFIHVTGTDGFTWEDVFLDPRPVVVFVTTGGSDIEGAAARLILGNAINTRIQMWPHFVATHTGDGQPHFPKELRILVDETRLLGNCAAIVTAVTETGKMGVSLMMWVLGMRDIFDIYPEASVITNSCNAVIFGGGTEMSTYEDFSKAIGEKTIANPARSESDNGSSQSESDQARRVRKADELRRMPTDELAAVMGVTSIQPKKPFKIVGEGKQRRLVFL